LPKKCEKCRVNIAVKQCTQCFKEYCQFCAGFKQGICQVCMQIISKVGPNSKLSEPLPKNVDDYLNY
ncbi:MAG: hypothetical protein ACC656_13785, partial [Candidatus Heimdallarchaeota archaeon]